MRLILCIFAIMLGTSSLALAHSGGTNSEGCHREKATNGYHCH